MQQNLAEFPSKSRSRSSGNTMQPTPTHCAQFPRAANNPRFAVTPETMGIRLRSDTSVTSRMQQSQYAAPVVDLKSYYERQNKHPAGSFADCKQESSDGFQSSHSTMPTHSLRGASAGHCLSSFNSNNKAELMSQTPSPISSPQTPQQQWSFEHAIANSESLQLSAKISADNNKLLQSLKCAEEGGQPSLDAATSALCGQGSHSQRATSMPEIQMQCHDFSSHHSAKLNFKILNGVYAKRIEDIDANAWTDRDLKIFTYQEWVELLIKINESFLNNMEELEKEVACRLELMQRRANSNCRHSQGNEIIKYCKDIDTLLKYIKNTNGNKSWDFLRSLKLETLTANQLLDMLDCDNLAVGDNEGDEAKDCGVTDVVQRNKLYANMKALAQEVAEKHDEVRELKRQVICLEDEIQKAQKKIQLKDDVIKELRNDLKCANNKIVSDSSLETNPSMPPVNFETQIPCSASTQITDDTSAVNDGSQFDSLNRSELEEQEQIKILHNEINDLFEISDLSKQKIEQRHHKIKEVIAKVMSEKLAADRKLDTIRQQLIDLENESCEGKSDCDSGFRSNCENDQNTRLLDTIRQRLRQRNETICELKKKIQKLEMDKNVLSTSLETKLSISSRSSGILKEIADLLCDLRGQQISYTCIYNPGSSQMNPFCEAIMEMQKDFKEREAQLLQTLKTKSKENDELTELLLQSEKDYYHESALRSNLNDFADIDKAPVAQLQPPPPTSQLSPTLATMPSSTSPTDQQSTTHQ